MTAVASIARRIEAVRHAKAAKVREGRYASEYELTDAELTEILGDKHGGLYVAPNVRKAHAKFWRPSCVERVAECAARLARPGERVKLSQVARVLGESECNVGMAAKWLKQQGRWPYVVKAGPMDR